MQGDGFSLPWRERVRVRGKKIKAPSPLSSPVKGEEVSELTAVINPLAPLTVSGLDQRLRVIVKTKRMSD
jgi:hypothetical protein